MKNIGSDHKKLFVLYKRLKRMDQRKLFFKNMERKYSLFFDPYELLCLLVEEFITTQNPESDLVKRLTDGVEGSIGWEAWYSIVEEIKQQGFEKIADQMKPLISASEEHVLSEDDDDEHYDPDEPLNISLNVTTRP